VHQGLRAERAFRSARHVILSFPVLDPGATDDARACGVIVEIDERSCRAKAMERVCIRKG